MPFRELDWQKGELTGFGVDITEACHWNCPACFAKTTGRYMPKKLFKYCVDEAKRVGFREFYILGGEPGIRNDIVELLEYTAGKFQPVILVTNGVILAKEEVCKHIADMGIVIAVQRHTMLADSQAVKVQDIMVGKKGTLPIVNQAWANIEMFFAPEKVCVQCCILQPVVRSGHIFDVFKWCRAMGYEPVMEFTKEGRRFKRGSSLDVSPQEMLRVLLEFQKIDQENFLDKAAEILTPQAYGKTCHMLETSLHCLVDGTIVPCVGHHNIAYGKLPEQSLEEILNNPLRALMINPAKWIYGYCKECEYFERCTGGCRGSAFDMSGCPRASFYYCPHIPRDKLTLRDMIPTSCSGCPLENHYACYPKV